jgi:hypothetical protein
MKKLVVLTAIPLFFMACSNPLLKWIETPAAWVETPGRTVSRSDKAITSFSFGIPGEAVLIGLDPGEDGNIPITVVLPAGNDPSRLTPFITFIGRSLTPGSGEPGNFNFPVEYRVTAEDGSFQNYLVQVYVRSESSRAIVRFALTVSGTGGNTMAEGVITENAEDEIGDVVIYVPSGTDLTNLAAQILHTGKSLHAPNARGLTDYPTSLISLTGDFSRPVIYRVTSDNNRTKDYTVTVVKAKDSAKEITGFSIKGWESRETVIIGAVPMPDGKIPIVVTLPAAAAGNLSGLTPVISYKGVAIAGAGIAGARNTSAVGQASAAGPINFDHVSVSYTVIAEDGTTRDYEVTVYASGDDNSKQITGFYFVLPGSPAQEAAVGIINETAKTIAVTVPPGTSLQALAPEIYHTGTSVRPISGEPKNFSSSAGSPVNYTVYARDGSSQIYKVSVFTAASGAKDITRFEFEGVSSTAVIGSVPGADGRLPVVVTVPSGTSLLSLKPVVTHTGISITGAGVPSGGPGMVRGQTASFANPQGYRVQAEDGTAQDYTVTVVAAANTNPAQPRIDFFYFTNPLAVGTINQTYRTIAVTLPYGTNVKNLSPVILYSGYSVRPASGAAVTENPASLPPEDFSAPKVYTARGTTGNEEPYTVTVTVMPNSAKEITALSFTNVDAAKTTVVISSAPDNTGTYPIDAAVPTGTPLGSLIPRITHTGVSITGPGVPSGPGTVTAGSGVNFASPQTYTVRAEDGSTRNYAVTVRTVDNNVKQITGFFFTTPLAVGDIDEAAKTITVTVPYGVNLGALRPTVYFKGVSLSPVSGMANSFTSPAVYTVSAANGTAQAYTVRVTAKQSGAKEITGFTIPGVAVIDTVIGAAPGPDGYIPIAVTVPEKTNLDSLTPSVTHTGKTISPASGSSQNFNRPVSYQVTAEDGTVKDYTVQIHRASGNSKIITGFAFRSVPAMGYIDQGNYTIAVLVPAGTSRANLIPEISYIGASLTPPGGTAQTANPLVDSPRNFTGSQTYTVKAPDGSGQAYTVTVSEEARNVNSTVTFLGITDPSLIETDFNQSTGALTIRIRDTVAFTAPYEWYLDGHQYPVSGSILTLKTGDLSPGQHEVVALARQALDGKHYTNKVYFLVNQ